MLRKILTLTSLVIFLSFTKQKDPETFKLTVKVDGLRNAKGVVQFAIYNKDGSIPDEHYKRYYRKKVAVIDGQTAVITFEGLPKGTYAVNILHDENENGKIDKGFVLPKEGIGFSNYSSIGLTNRPKFSKASFELNNDKEITVKVIYM